MKKQSLCKCGHIKKSHPKINCWYLWCYCKKFVLPKKKEKKITETAEERAEALGIKPKKKEAFKVCGCGHLDKQHGLGCWFVEDTGRTCLCPKFKILTTKQGEHKNCNPDDCKKCLDAAMSDMECWEAQKHLEKCTKCEVSPVEKIEKLEKIHFGKGTVTEVDIVNRFAEIREKINEIIDRLR